MDVLFRLLNDARFQKGRKSAAFLLYLLILFLGSIPGAREEVGAFASGFVLHAAAYGTITFLLIDRHAIRPTRHGLSVVLLVAAMGAMDEGLQTLLPYRTGSLGDWLVDTVAATLVMTICLRWRYCATPPSASAARGEHS